MNNWFDNIKECVKTNLNGIYGDVLVSGNVSDEIVFCPHKKQNIKIHLYHINDKDADLFVENNGKIDFKRVVHSFSTNKEIKESLMKMIEMENDAL